MTNTFLYSDPHFGHQGVCNFTRNDGSPLRPWDRVEEMDEVLVERFNKVVGPKDKVYFLGDVAMRKPGLQVVKRLNGDLVLIKGNHDIFELKDYLSVGFRDIRACHVLSGMIMTHIPVHPSALERFGANIHGHLHANRVMRDCDSGDAAFPTTEIDPRYHCVCVEHTDYAPISFDDVKKRIEAEGGLTSFKEKK